MTNTPVQSTPPQTEAPAPVSVEVPPQKKERRSGVPLQFILGAIALFVLLLGGIVGFVLMSKNSELRQQAAGGIYTCASGTGCTGVVPGGACVGMSGTCIGTAGGACTCRTSGSSTPTPVASPGGGGSCSTNSVSSPPGGCIAIHLCDSLSSGQCTILSPQVTSGTVNPQQIANDNCKCVQADVLNGLNNSCVNGHINGDPSTLLCATVVCPTNCGGQTPRPTVRPSTQPSAQPSPRPSPSPSTTPSPVPSPTPGTSPAPSPTPAPVCVSIVTNQQDIKVGEDITFTCGNVPGATSYEFRVKLPDGSIQTLAAASNTSNISSAFTVSQPGQHKAQCRICVGSTQSCQEWEPL